jgi:hypothetical protein
MPYGTSLNEQVGNDAMEDHLVIKSIQAKLQKEASGGRALATLLMRSRRMPWRRRLCQATTVWMIPTAIHFSDMLPRPTSFKLEASETMGTTCLLSWRLWESAAVVANKTALISTKCHLYRRHQIQADSCGTTKL